MSHGALLIHGFTATPECMEPIAGPLREKGTTVAAPLLAGHGASPFELSKTTWQDWYQGVEKAFDSLHEKTTSVCVVGLSLGGLLALLLASRRPVEKLALLATPVFFKGFTTEKILPFVGNSFLRKIYRYQPKWTGPAINDPKGRASFKSYTKMPIAGLMQIIQLQKEVRARLASITPPTLIIHSPHDDTAPYENMAFLKENLGSKTIQTVILERSNHVLTMDYEKNRVVQEVVSFFQKEIL